MWQTPATRIVLASAVVATVGACNGTGDDSTFAERQELANIRTKNVVPLTSGATLMNTFRDFCLEGETSVAGRTDRLRAAGFVPVGGWRGGMRTFVADDKRPVVKLSDDGHVCGVTARARTGQDVVIRQRVAEWFPDAQPLPVAEKTRALWSTGRATDEAIGILRTPRGRKENEISVALLRP